MILFLTNTPTQLLNATILKETAFQDERCDLYYTENLRTFIDRINLLGIFENCYEVTLLKDICTRNNTIEKMIVRIKNGLDFPIVKRTLPSNPIQYDRVFASGISLRNFEIYYAIKNLNPKVKLSLYEEGICEYYNLGLPHSKSRALFSHLFFRHYYFEDCDSLYVYTPEAAVNTWPNITVHKIPFFTDNVEIRNIINSIFNYSPTELSVADGKVVVLEQAFYDEVQNNEQEEIIRVLSEVFGEDKIIIKLHPRSIINKYGPKYQYVKTNIPFEIIALNEAINEKCVFVSISSSSVLNLKLMLNQEARIVMLHRYNNPDAVEPGCVYEYIRKAYGAQKFYTPADKSELLLAAQDLSGKTYV